VDAIFIKVPARICFFGDHQDYLGLPVIAGTINRYITLKAYPITEKDFKIELKDLKTSITIPLNDSLNEVQKNDYFRSGMAVVKEKGFDFVDGYQIEISGNIPLNAGLSSSSALVVAWIRFLATQGNIKITDEEIGRMAYKAEVEFFNQPGGLMDQYTIAQGGLLYIDTKTGKTVNLPVSLGGLVVAESGIEKETQEVLKNARVYQEKAIAQVKKAHPKFEIQKTNLEDYERYLNLVSEEYHKYWYAAIYNYDITKKAKQFLHSGFSTLVMLGELMNMHQKILEQCIQNTPPAMIKMMSTAIRAGAFGAKIIGSGGGGCMVAIVEKDKIKSVKDAFLKGGAKATYEVELV
jgi:galactokinase